MTKHNRITYRFDRQGNKIEDTVPVQDMMQQPAVQHEKMEPSHKNEQKWSFEEPANEQETTPLNEYEIDIEKLERIIRESSPEATYEPKQQEEQSKVVELNERRQDKVTKATVAEHSSSIKQQAAKKKAEEMQLQEQWINNEDYERSYSYARNNDEEQRLYELDRAEETAIEHNEHEQHTKTRDDNVEDTAPSAYIRANEHYVASRKPLPWLNSAISVISAIATGICIGYLLLSLVFGVSVWPLSALAQPKQAEQALTTEPFDDSLPAAEQREVKEIAPETALQLSAASFNYHVLQAGVFTQEKTRDEVLASLQQSGLKGHYLKDSSDRYFVYAGVATSATNAAPIQGGIKGIETYRKEMTINLPAQIAFKGEAEKLEQYFADSNALIAMYADLVAAQLEQTSFSKIGQASQDAWQAAYGSWLTLAEQVETNWVDEADKQQAMALKEELMNADKQLQSYQAEPKSTYLWNVQASLVKSVLIQKDWFE